MTRFRTFRIALSVLLMSVGMAAGGLLGSATASASSKPMLVVSPSTGLKKGQTVRVSGTGFKAHDQVYVVQCLATAKGAGQCDSATAIAVTITRKGILPTTNFKVITGKIGSRSCGTTRSNLRKCALSAGNASGGDSAVAPIVFKAPKIASPRLTTSPSTGLKKGQTVRVSGTGFKAHDQVYVVQCLATAKGAGQCDSATAIAVTITRKGILPTTNFKVITGKIGSRSCGTTRSNLRKCALSAGNASGGDSVAAPIVFKAP